MTKAVEVPEPPPARLCWICWQPLVAYEGVDGRVVLGCPPCRREIERLQAFWRQMHAPAPRGLVEEARRKADEAEVRWARRGARLKRRYHRCGRGELREARRVAAREGLAAAARATGLNYWTLYGRAKREGWRVRSVQRKAAR